MRSETAMKGIVLFALGAVVASIGYGFQSSSSPTGGPGDSFYYPMAYLAMLTQGGGWLATGLGAVLAAYGTVRSEQHGQ